MGGGGGAGGGGGGGGGEGGGGGGRSAPQVSVLVRADLQKLRFSIFGSVMFMVFCYFFTPRDPSKKLQHVVRIDLVQFSASELQ